MRTAPVASPFLQILALLAFGAFALLALAFGAFLLMLLLAAGLVIALIGILRGGGLRWQVRRRRPQAGEGQVIEGEYRRR